MQTHFSDDQLENFHLYEAEQNFRKCVHCGFCLAACPTYALQGDERDSPRGRIYMMKEMFESGATPTTEIVSHIDRCLSCLACKTACPSGVDYQHLVDHARAYIERMHRRPLLESIVRKLLAAVLPHPFRFRWALHLANLVRPFLPLLDNRVRQIVSLAPRTVPAKRRLQRSEVYPAASRTKFRVTLLRSCAQQVLRPEIDDATIRILSRIGCELRVPRKTVCCGALVHHMGHDDEALITARKYLAAWTLLSDDGGPEAVVSNAAGCGTMIKDYGYLLQGDPEWSKSAAQISSITRDATEIISSLGLPECVVTDLPVVAYHDACSLSNGQGITAEPRALLRSVGFEVREVPGGGACCGSAGLYNLLQPDYANALRDRKMSAIDQVECDIIATANIGCLTQLGSVSRRPVVHVIELLDWATGGPVPNGI